MNAKYYSNGNGFLSLPVPYCSFLFPLPLRPIVSSLSAPTQSRFVSPPSTISFLLRPVRHPHSISLSSLSRRAAPVCTQLRRPWDKRLHFLIFKCAQTSYPAIVCPVEAPRRGFRADKPLQLSMHAAAASYARVSLFRAHLFHSVLLRWRGSRWKMQIATVRATVMKS